jgi:hypothetical protein
MRDDERAEALVRLHIRSRAICRTFLFWIVRGIGRLKGRPCAMGCGCAAFAPERFAPISCFGSCASTAGALRRKNVNRESRIPTLRNCSLTTARSSSN